MATSWTTGIAGSGMDGAVASPYTATTIQTDTGELEVSFGGLWWERFHIFARSIAVGSIVNDVVVTLGLFNADRGATRSWTALAINADGVTTNAPTLTKVFQPLEYLEVDVTISADGVSNVDGDLTFTVSGVTIVVPITFSRLLIIPYYPEIGVQEQLEWKTVIVGSVNDGERRQAVRSLPRQWFSYKIFRELGVEEQRLSSRLALVTGKNVALPLFHFRTDLTSAVTIGDTVINVESTANRDFRTDQVMIRASETDYELLTVSSVGSTTITLSNGTTKAFAAGAEVYPVREAYLAPNVPSTRNHIGLAVFTLQFQVTESVDLADLTGWTTYNSKVVIDDKNLGEELSEAWVRESQILEGENGPIDFFTIPARARRTSQKGFLTQSLAELWDVYQLLHSMRGRQGSFYLPTGRPDFTATQPLGSGSTDLDVANVGYTDMAGATPVVPFDKIRVLLNDGTTILRTIQSTAVLSADEERLTVDTGWPSTIAVADVDRIEFLENARFDADRVTINHQVVGGDAEIFIPVRSLNE